MIKTDKQAKIIGIGLGLIFGYLMIQAKEEIRINNRIYNNYNITESYKKCVANETLETFVEAPFYKKAFMIGKKSATQTYLTNKGYVNYKNCEFKLQPLIDTNCEIKYK